MQTVLRTVVWLIWLGAATARGSELPRTPGTHRQTLRTERFQALPFTLSLPDAFPAKVPLPLVVGLHYGGRVTPWFGGRFLEALLEPGMRGLDAIIAAPDCPSTEGWTHPEAEAAVLELIRFLRQQYPVDGTRIVLVGYSMGGIGTWHLAWRHSGLFSAAIALAAIPDPASLEASGDTPLFAIHGRRDERFSVRRLGAVVRTLQARGRPVSLRVVEGLGHYQAAGYTEPLRDALPWVRQIWADRAGPQPGPVSP